MRRTLMIGAALVLAAAGGPGLAAGPAPAGNQAAAAAASHGPAVLLVCNGSTAPCPAGPAEGEGPGLREARGSVPYKKVFLVRTDQADSRVKTPPGGVSDPAARRSLST